MNWARYMQAMDAQTVMTSEDARSAFLGGRIKTMSEDLWKIIAENEEILRKYDDG